jgi:hypothetical protein
MRRPRPQRRGFSVSSARPRGYRQGRVADVGDLGHGIHYRERLVPDRRVLQLSEIACFSGHGWQRLHNQRKPSNQYLRERQIEHGRRQSAPSVVLALKHERKVVQDAIDGHDQKDVRIILRNLPEFHASANTVAGS